MTKPRPNGIGLPTRPSPEEGRDLEAFARIAGHMPVGLLRTEKVRAVRNRHGDLVLVDGDSFYLTLADAGLRLDFADGELSVTQFRRGHCEGSVVVPAEALKPVRRG